MLNSLTPLSGIGSNITSLNYNNLYNVPSGLISSNSTSNMFLTLSGGQLTGSLGIGTTTTSSLELYSTTQLQPRIILSGQQFYNNTGLTTGGIALLCGVNTLANRQLWLADSANLTSNTTNPVLRLMPNQGGITYPCVDAIATDGNTRLPLGLGGNAIILANGNVGIGLTNPSTTLQVNGTLNATTILENNVNISSKYLQLSGGSLTGTLGIGTNSLISGTSIDCRGSIWAYSLVIMDSSTVSGNNVFTLGNYELTLNSPTASAAATIQTIRQGYDYNQNLTLQAIGTGNVGIGKTNPGYKIDVNGNGRVHNGTTVTEFYIGNGNATSALNLWDIGGAAWRIYTSSSNLYFTNGTIGGTLTQKFYADFNGYLYFGNGGNLRIGGNDGTNTIYSPAATNIGITLNYATNSAGTINLGFNGGNGNIVSIANTATTISQKLIVNANTGIGTTNPNASVELYSTTQAQPRIILSGQEFYQAANTSTSGVALLAGVNRTGNRQLWFADSSLLTSNTTNPTFRIFINSTSSSYGIDCIATDGNTRLPMSIGGNITILANGNVGIGTATSSYLLNLYSTSGPQLFINGTNPGIVFNNSSGGCIAQATVAAAYSTSANVNDVVVRSPAGNLLILQSGTNAGTMFVTSTNVGIGVTNPSCKLSFGTTVSNRIISLYDSGNDYQFVGLGANNGLCLNIYNNTDAFQFRAGSSTTTANELMRITGTGNVGIGITNPSNTLDVNGTINANTIKESGTALTSKYLQLSGGSLTGDLKLNYGIPNIQWGATNGNNIAIAGTIGGFSTSAAIGDMVIRSLQTMYILTGYQAPAIKIPTTNIVEIPSLVSATSFVYKGVELSTTLTTNYQSILAINSNINISNINCSNIYNSNLTTTSNLVVTTTASANTFIESGTALTSKYLQLSGGTINGLLYITSSTTWQSSFEIDGSATNKYQFNVGGTTNTAIGTNALGIYDGNSAVNGYVMVFKSGNIGIGTTNPNAKLDVFGNINISNSLIALPSYSTNYGGNGDRIILYPGISSSSTYPYSIGINNGSLWNSIPTGANFNWYINGVNIFNLNGTYTAFYNNSGNARLVIDGGGTVTMAGNLVFGGGGNITLVNTISSSNINISNNLVVNSNISTSNIIENGIALSSKYQATLTSSTILSGIGSNITLLNTSNITSGTLPIGRGGTGASYFNLGQILIGNGINQIAQNVNLTWNGITNTLSTSNLNATQISENGIALSSKYLNSNILPNLKKKNGFTINCSNAVTLSGTSYYKYDINLANYTQMLYLDGASNLPYRTFSIKCLPVSGVFSSNGNPNIIQYDIYISSNISAGTSNVCAIGVPQNINLNQIPNSSSLFLLETTYFNYISVISATAANINCIIEDYLN